MNKSIIKLFLLSSLLTLASCNGGGGSQPSSSSEAKTSKEDTSNVETSSLATSSEEESSSSSSIETSEETSEEISFTSEEESSISSSEESSSSYEPPHYDYVFESFDDKFIKLPDGATELAPAMKDYVISISLSNTSNIHQKYIKHTFDKTSKEVTKEEVTTFDIDVYKSNDYGYRHATYEAISPNMELSKKTDYTYLQLSKTIDEYDFSFIYYDGNRIVDDVPHYYNKEWGVGEETYGFDSVGEELINEPYLDILNMGSEAYIFSSGEYDIMVINFFKSDYYGDKLIDIQLVYTVKGSRILAMSSRYISYITNNDYENIDDANFFSYLDISITNTYFEYEAKVDVNSNPITKSLPSTFLSFYCLDVTKYEFNDKEVGQLIKSDRYFLTNDPDRADSRSIRAIFENIAFYPIYAYEVEAFIDALIFDFEANTFSDIGGRIGISTIFATCFNEKMGEDLALIYSGASEYSPRDLVNIDQEVLVSSMEVVANLTYDQLECSMDPNMMYIE